MKILLTFFVLFFSSSIYAGDDLGGNKIFCSKDRNHGAVLFALNFINNFEVKIYKETSDIPLERTTLKYKTSAVKIHITNYYHTDRKYYIISRNDLAVETTGWTSVLWSFEKGECNLVSGSIIDLFNQHLKDYKKNNKI